jgi:aryl-alcohol dehydrogenase-like predicted oxidoreductase
MERLFRPRRQLGRTGFVATVLGIGDLADQAVPLEQCVATARRALEAGLNVIDTAPGYEDGYSERIVGQALCGRRDGVFVIDKIDHPDRSVGPQVEGSLERLGLEAADAFVFHGVSTLDGWRRIAAAGGPMDELGACREAGRCRFRGISSHDPAVLLAAIESGTCDVVLFAVGAYADRRYVAEVLPLARRRGVGTVCFKTFGAGKLVCDTEGYGRPLARRPREKVSSGGGEAREGVARKGGLWQEASGPARPDRVPSEEEDVLPRLSVAECVRYTLTRDPDVALLGMSFPNEQDAAFEAAMDFAPMSGEEMAEVERRAARAVAGKGKCWWNPQG